MNRALIQPPDQERCIRAQDHPEEVEAIIHPASSRNQGGIVLNLTLAETAASLNTRFGAGTIWRGGEPLKQSRYTTGFAPLDTITGGIPRGRVVEVFGEESSGKSALALHMARQTGEVLYMDADNALADGRGLYVMRPDCLEDALQAVEIAAPAFDAVVIDTLTALQTREETELRIGEFHAKRTAAVVLSHALPRLLPVLQRNGCTLFLVTQLRNVPGILYGRPDRPNGGHALRHYAALRMETRRIEHIRQKGEIVGQTIRATVLKNKFGAPDKTAYMALMYCHGWRAAG